MTEQFKRQFRISRIDPEISEILLGRLRYVATEIWNLNLSNVIWQRLSRKIHPCRCFFGLLRRPFAVSRATGAGADRAYDEDISEATQHRVERSKWALP